MRTIKLFLKRRFWIFRRNWFMELTITLIFPLVLYLSLVIGLESVFEFSPEGIPYPHWVIPGIIFLMATVMIYLPVFVDLFEERQIVQFYESVVSTPNTNFSIVMAISLSLIPEVLIKSVITSIILVQLVGFAGLKISVIGAFLFLIILLFLVSNLAITLSLLIRRAVIHLSLAFILSFFIYFSSDWIIPLEFFPSSLYSIFSYLPTTQLIDGCRLILFNGQLSLFTWIIPLFISLIWLLVNTVIFTRATSR